MQSGGVSAYELKLPKTSDIYVRFGLYSQITRELYQDFRGYRRTPVNSSAHTCDGGCCAPKDFNLSQAL
jgi:hypothetical protein